jgi:hypothetical protein
MERVYVIEYYYTTQMTKNGLMSVSRILEERIQDVATIPQYIDTQIPSVLYWALQNQN